MDFFTALESGWRAGRKQFLKRRTELRRDAELSTLLAARHAEGLKYPNPPHDQGRDATADPETALQGARWTQAGARGPDWTGPAPLAPMPADVAAELNAIRSIMHPADGPDTRPAVFPLDGPLPIRGPQEHAS